MKIAMMSAWNTDSGVAVHAEPLAKVWVKLGHEVTIFSFVREDFHGEGFTGKDEDFVIRCFGTDFRTKYLDPRPFLTTDYEIFVVQDVGVLPKENLAKIFGLIKKKAKTIHVVHENSLSEDPAFYQFDWDAIVYFDERQDFLKKIYPDACHIPFPCFPLRQGDRIEARKKLGLPLDRKIIFFFCQRGYSLYLPERNKELKDVVFLIVGPKRLEVLEKFSPDPNTIVREEEVLTKERFDLYLFASDAVVLHKFQSRFRAVVSSTAYQILGTGCPILVPKASDFFYPFSQEVLKYSDTIELRENLIDILNNGKRSKEVKRAASSYVKRYSDETIARKYLELFEKIKH